MPDKFFFVGGYSLRQDSNGDYYTAPQWEQTGAGQGIAAHRHPYLYKVGEPITFDPIVFKKHPNSEDPTEPIDIQGTGSDGAEFGPASMSVYNELAYPVGPIQADRAFSSTTEYEPEYSIHWMFSTDGKPFSDPSKEWRSAGTTSHILYACLADPAAHSASLYRSVVHLACSNDGAVNEDEAVAKTWALLEGPTNFKGWDEAAKSWTRPLYYYQQGTSLTANATGLASLLAIGTGRCSAWAQLLQKACELNGKESELVEIKVEDLRLPPVNGEYQTVGFFGIGAWNIPSEGTYDGNGKEYFPYAVDYTGGTPLVVGDFYGDIKNETGLPGQNTPTPSLKFFSEHVIVRIANSSSDLLLDPSYGIQYGNLQSLPYVIAGFSAPNLPPNKRMADKRTMVNFRVIEV